MRFVAVLLIGLLPSAVRADVQVQAGHELVIAGHPLAAQMGMDVLHHGGNAADALITVSLALGVAEPGNSGLGGKMVLLYYEAKTKTVSAVVALDAAPRQFQIDQFRDLPPARRQRGWAAVCTPGLVAALDKVHQKWASKSWADLVTPAADLAQHGFPISERAAQMLAVFPAGINHAADQIYSPNGHTPTAGAIFTNPDLAHTLHLLAERGPGDFYDGQIARKLLAGSRAAGGCLSADDLRNYRARVLEPTTGKFRGFDVFSSPPPLSGGTTLIAALECLDKFDLPSLHPRDARYIDTVGRVLQQVYPQVVRCVGDVPDSMQRVGRMLSDGTISQLVARARSDDPRDPDTRASADTAVLDDSLQASTTHLIIIDRDGNIACCTQSLGLEFGAAVVAEGTGFLLNADIGNFSLETANSLNYIVPGKWPRSTMAPTIFLKDQKPVLVIGSPAGQRIPTAVLQVSLDVLELDRPLRDAVLAPRFHVRSGISSGPNAVDLESGFAQTMDAQLTSMGWNVHRRDDSDFYFGSVNAALLHDGVATGVADVRRTSDAAGD